MKGKLVAMLCVSLLGVSLLSGCGDSEKEAQAVQEETVEPEESDTETTDVTDEETSEEESSKEEPVSVADLGDAWVNMESRSFAVNGNVYTLGVSTLQDMIDDGVPFDEDDLANAQNNLNSNTESGGFKIVLGEYYNAQVCVSNITDGNMVTADCPLSQIYLPVDLEDSNEILTFAFPLTMTEDELVAQAGEPTDKDEYTSEDGGYQKNTYEYKEESNTYYGDSGYTFEFNNGELAYVTIDWMP